MMDLCGFWMVRGNAEVYEKCMNWGCNKNNDLGGQFILFIRFPTVIPTKAYFV